MSRNIIIKFSFIYIILLTILISLFYTNHKSTTQSYLEKKSKEHYLNFKAIYNEHKILSDMVFNTDINTSKTIELFKEAYKTKGAKQDVIRKKLHEHLSFKYQKLKKYNLKQLHFHLPNNDSFLRMHRPNKFGDNLSNVRATVKFVNENKKYIHGFEEGRIFNGFRFIYPLFSQKEHIGSVEISFSALAMIDTIVNAYNVDSQFLIRKDVVETKVFDDEKSNYIPSPNKDYYFEKSIYEKHKPIVAKDTTVTDFKHRVEKGEPFSLYLEQIQYIKTFIPIKNPISNEVVAILCICQNDPFISKDKANMYSLSILSIISLGLILYLFLMQKLSNEKLKEVNKKLDKRIDLEVKRSRKKDISIMNHAKMASIADMLNNIAHQWRQPLNVISTSSSGLLIHKDFGTLDDENFKLLTESIIEKTDYLSKTIDNFREYITDNTDDKKKFLIQDRVNKAINIIEATLEYNNIKIEKKFDEENLYITMNVGELIQVLLNILNNAKDALIKNNEIGDRNIQIVVKKKDDKTILITIEDNAGGIPKNIIKKVFDPYFTTKHESIGTGISLYLCYEIVTNNLNGDIYVKNKDKGAKFYLELPLDK